MKQIKRAAAQGDVFFRRVTTLPVDAVKSKKAEEYIVAHSETGHHHIATGAKAHYTVPGNDMIAYLSASGPVPVVHHRAWDTHEPVELYSDKGSEVIWEIRRQREALPGGLTRKVVDQCERNPRGICSHTKMVALRQQVPAHSHCADVASP